MREGRSRSKCRGGGPVRVTVKVAASGGMAGPRSRHRLAKQASPADSTILLTDVKFRSKYSENIKVAKCIYLVGSGLTCTYVKACQQALFMCNFEPLISSQNILV